MKEKRKIWPHIVAILVLLGSAALSVFRYQASLYRVVAAAKDFAFSMRYYFLQFFLIDADVTVTKLPDEKLLEYLPFDVSEILRKFRDMWKIFFKGECFAAYWRKIADFIYDFSMIAMLLIPCILMLWLVLKKAMLKPNKDKHGKKSKTVLFIEKRGFRIGRAIKRFVLAVYNVFVRVRVYKISFVLLWLLNFNILTVILEFFAYYFYFAMAFDFINLPLQLVKLLLDLLIMLSGAPIIFWLLVTYVVICIVREKLGLRNLKYRENLDRAFIDRRPLIVMYTGTMGTGKTTALTSAAISTEIMFRDKALELMTELEMKFPNFPWINLEDELKRAIKYCHILNLTGCRDFVGKKKARWYKSAYLPKKSFGYDIGKYRSLQDDSLTVSDIWETLEDYACLYFIYIIESSLIVSNYSVRVDGVLDDGGNFPLWSHDLFKRKPEEAFEVSRHSHVLDFDVLRLGKKLLEENERSGSLEFGVILISEIAKERGNQLTLQEIKKGDAEANQKNDLFSYSLKMCRHKATVCGYPFVRFFCDEQRPESLSADVRELMDLVHIEKKRELELLMPCFFVTELLHDLLYPRFQAFYREYRYYRGDMSFFMWVLLNFFSAFHNHYKRIYNRFGCNVLDVAVESGAVDEQTTKERIHILHKKVYSDRFSTDCYHGFFETQLRETTWSFDDYPEYADTVASREELDFQNSYFIRDLEEKTK